MSTTQKHPPRRDEDNISIIELDSVAVSIAKKFIMQVKVTLETFNTTLLLHISCIFNSCVNGILKFMAKDKMKGHVSFFTCPS